MDHGVDVVKSLWLSQLQSEGEGTGLACGADSPRRQLQDADGAAACLQDGFRAVSPGMLSKLAA